MTGADGRRREPAGGFVIEADDPWRDDVRRLLAEHRAFALTVTPPESVHALAPDDALEGGITFFSVRKVDGELLGIGALRQLDPEHVEVKSMHTTSAARRRGVGRALVDRLVAEAAARGARRVSLETGTGEAFAPARALYAASGFAACEPFGEYQPTPHNTFMTRYLV
ncbi:MAG TPA: GNAT family N-acetyltransferase [Gaiellaceae bacterium]|nr:GNAT family N-acetyltransferase [Gaiellaceae bacterium]